MKTISNSRLIAHIVALMCWMLPMLVALLVSTFYLCTYCINHHFGLIATLFAFLLNMLAVWITIGVWGNVYFSRLFKTTDKLFVKWLEKP